MAKHETQQRILSLDVIVLDKAYYVRASENHWGLVTKYYEALKKGAKFPPIHVVPSRGGKFVILDGFNRLKAHQRAKQDTIAALVHTGLPKKKWVETAYRLNSEHGEPLNVQDRSMVAYKLQKAGYSVARLGELLQAQESTILKWLDRGITTDKGDDTALKPALAGFAGTSEAKEAAQRQGPIGHGSALKAFTEVIALLEIGAVDLALPAVREKVFTALRLLKELTAGEKAG